MREPWRRTNSKIVGLALGLTVLLVRVVPVYGDSPLHLVFENDWVRVVREHYDGKAISEEHTHPATPTVYVYTTDGGAMRFHHKGSAGEPDETTERPPVKVGQIRYNKGALETHVVENVGVLPSEYLRLELKTEPVDLPQKDVRLAPELGGEKGPLQKIRYESGQVRIIRVVCAAASACPKSEHPEDPAVMVALNDQGVAYPEPGELVGASTGELRAGTPVWVKPGSLPWLNQLNDRANEYIRVELKTGPKKGE